MRNRSQSKLFTFEGIDGSGKSTQAENLRCSLMAMGYSVPLYREPGGPGVGTPIRELLLSREYNVTGNTRNMLYIASMVDLVDKRLRYCSSDVVIVDRYIHSTLAYGVLNDPSSGVNMYDLWEVLRCMKMVPTYIPDRTFLLDMCPARAAERMAGEEPDQVEIKGLIFQEKVRKNYLRLEDGCLLLHGGPSIMLIDADRDAEIISNEILEEALRILNDDQGDRINHDRGDRINHG